MTLRQKIYFLLGPLLIGLLVASYLMLSSGYLDRFRATQEADTREHLAVFMRVFEREQQNLSTKLSDWSQWDDTYAFMSDRSGSYIDSNLNDESLEALEVNLMLYVGNDGAPVYSKQVYEGNSETVSEEVFNRIIEAKGLLSFSPEEVSHTALLQVGLSHPVLVASRPIVMSDGSGEPRGTLVWGRIMDEAFFRGIDEVVGFSSEHIVLGEKRVWPREISRLRSVLAKDSPIVATLESKEVVRGYLLLSDISDRPLVLVATTSDPQIYRDGERHLIVFGIFFSGVSVIFLVFIFFVLEYLVLRRVDAIHRQLGTMDTTNGSILLSGSDEFSDLGRAINETYRRLRASQQWIVEREQELDAFRLTVDRSYDHIIITDPEGIILYANPAAEKLTGFTFAEMKGKTPALWGKQMPKEFYEEFWRVIKTRKIEYNGKILNKRKDGSRYFSEITVSPVTDGSGQVRYFIGVERILTEETPEGKNRNHANGHKGSVQERPSRYVEELERRNAFLERNEKAVINIIEDMKESEDRLKARTLELHKFKQAVDGSFDHIIITDPEGIILYANPAAEKLTGFTFAEMKGKTPALWGKQMPKEFYEEFWRVIKTEKKTFRGEIRNRRKSGEIYISAVHAVPILEEDESVQFFVGVERDITEERERQRAEQEYLKNLESANTEIRTQKSRAEEILRYLRSIGEGVYATDRHGTVVFINETAARTIGKRSSDVLMLPSDTLFRFQVGEGDEPYRLDATDEAIRFGRPLSFPDKTFLQKSDTEMIPVAGTYAPILEEGHTAGAIVVFQDISERYQLEHLKEQFLSVAAHQLRTPLGSMRWSMELLMSGDLGPMPEAAKTTLEDLYRNSDRMLELVNDLLNVSRIDQGKGKEDPTSVDLGAILNEIVASLSGDIERYRVTVSVKLPRAGLPNICVPRRHFFEAIENLVSNAIHYNRPQGTVTIKASVRGETLTLTVSDTGIGIPQGEQSKIFSKFFRASNAIRAITDGSGLGLAVVKSYIEECGGTVEFESKENSGTTFTVRLPLSAICNMPDVPERV